MASQTRLAKPPRLYQRGKIWWYRVKVPRRLITILGRHEYRFSLKTDNLGLAATREREHSKRVDAEIDRAWRRLRTLGEHPPQLTTTLPTESLKEAFSDVPAHYFGLDWDRYSEHGTKGDLDKAVDEILKRAGYVVPTTSNLFHQARSVAREKLGHKRLTLAAEAQLQASAEASLGHWVETYKLEREANWNVKTRISNATSLKILLGVLGAPLPISAMDDAALTRVRSIMEQFPPNAFGLREFQGLDVLTITQAASIQQKKPLSSRSVATYMGNLKTFVRWAQDRGAITTDLTQSPCFQEYDGIDSGSSKRAFTVKELDQMLAAPLYAGCKNDRSAYHRPGPNHPRRGRFWIPLLALYGGMPLGMSCDLTLAQAKRYRDQDYLELADGERFDIPKIFVRLGWRTLLSQARAVSEDALLFPELTTGSSGYKSDPFSKWFARFLVSAGLDDQRLSFQSLILAHQAGHHESLSLDRLVERPADRTP